MATRQLASSPPQCLVRRTSARAPARGTLEDARRQRDVAHVDEPRVARCLAAQRVPSDAKPRVASPVGERSLPRVEIA